MLRFSFPDKSIHYGILFALIAAAQNLSGCGDSATGPGGDPDAQLVLLAPRGGETVHVGDILHVRWKAQGKGLEEINSVTVWLSPDSGTTWISLTKGSIGVSQHEWGDFGWKVPASMESRGTAFDLAGRTGVLVQIQDYQDDANPHKTATLGKPFAIQP